MINCSAARDLFTSCLPEHKNRTIQGCIIEMCRIVFLLLIGAIQRFVSGTTPPQVWLGKTTNVRQTGDIKVRWIKHCSKTWLGLNIEHLDTTGNQAKDWMGWGHDWNQIKVLVYVNKRVHWGKLFEKNMRTVLGCWEMCWALRGGTRELNHCDGAISSTNMVNSRHSHRNWFSVHELNQFEITQSVQELNPD